MGIALGLMLLVIAFCSLTGNSTAKELGQQEVTIQKLENEIAALSAKISAGNETVVSNTTGISMERVSHDNDIVRPLLQTMTTWTNYQEYTNARLDIMENYGLSAQSAVMKTFFPEYPDISDREGNSYNFIDYYKLSCNYRGMRSMVRGISDTGVYSYFTVVGCTGNKNGNGSSFNLALLYSIDANGRISEFDAYTMDGYVWVETNTGY